MKRFLFQIIGFSIFITLLSIVYDYTFTTYLKHNTSNCLYATENEIMQGKIDADIIIMGSSRGRTQYSPLVLDSILHVNSYNLSLDSKTFYTQSMHYDVYRLHNKKPKLWIQNIDFVSTLGFYVKDRFDNLEANKELYYPYFADKDYMQAIERQSFSGIERNMPLYRYRGGLGKIPNPTYNYESYKGFHPYASDWQGDNTPEILNFCCVDSVKDLFCEYMQVAVQEDSIQVIFVYAPFYYKAIERVTNIDDCYSTFDSIAELYNIPILDYTFSYLSYDSVYFYDAGHLNQRGAELFSIELAHAIDSLEILK